jgi:ABC-type sugar transport system ATPase subunit
MERFMTDLRLERVSKRYDTASWGVRDIDLDVRRGELLAIVGASGSGKTTLLRLIAGLEQPSGGEVHLGGRRVTHLPPWERGIGLVAEAGALLPHLTVGENLEWSRRQRRRHCIGGTGKSGETEEDNRHELTALKCWGSPGLLLVGPPNCRPVNSKEWYSDESWRLNQPSFYWMSPWGELTDRVGCRWRGN